MAFFKKIDFTSDTDIYVWKITEDLNYLISNVILKPESLKRFESMKSESHKKGFLAVRMLLQHCGYSDHDLIYSESGKPSLIDGKYISITHSFDFSVIAISNKNIGIDIELNRDKVLRIANKFSNELFIEDQINDAVKIKLYTIIWGAKESIFKIVNEPGISFIDHINLNDFSLSSSKALANLNWNNNVSKFDIYFKEIENYTLVYANQQ